MSAIPPTAPTARGPLGASLISAHEVEFLPVGNGERSGDAIVLRYGPYPLRRETQRVVVIDAGYKETAEVVIDWLDRHYQTDHIDLMISTHPDQDHINGLVVLAEELTVGQIWMHQPWNHSAAVQAGRLVEFSNRTGEVAAGLSGASELEDVASHRDIPIVEPFTGLTFDGDVIEVLGPTEDYYESLLPFEPPTTTSNVVAKVLAAAGGVATRVMESLNIETLREEGGVVSARNNSSVITLLRLNGKQMLLTGDAGVDALDPAVDNLHLRGLTGGALDVVQLPHHGSRRNVGARILNDLLGSYPTTFKVGSGIVSAAKDSPKHPNPKVTNAFVRRGYPVYSTEGNSFSFTYNSTRSYTAGSPIPLIAEVPEDD